ncbi:MAG: FAD-dependent oxidoreductase [Pseudomonadota bacterium]
MAAKIAIIGAGMSGAVLARRLSDAGHSPEVFDKGRGLGGRMATRRVGDLAFDHGAVGFRSTAANSAFATQCAVWSDNSVSADWAGGMQVGLPGAGGPVKALLDGIPIARQTRIKSLSQTSSHWTLTSETDENFDGFDTVVITIPVPQLRPLLQTANADRAELGQVSYDPCWTLMLGMDPDAELGAPMLRLDTGPLAMIIDNGSKPGRPKGAWVAHATAQWSKDNLELDTEEAAQRLQAAVAKVHPAAADASYVTTHRWRYAHVAQPLGQPCIWDPDLRLGVAGDWCLGPNVSDAYESANALADRVLASLDMLGTEAKIATG